MKSALGLFCIGQKEGCSYIEADLGDIAGSVPDHHNKAKITIKPVTQFFWFPCVYKSYVYSILESIKCAIAFCLKQQCTYLNFKIFYCSRVLTIILAFSQS